MICYIVIRLTIGHHTTLFTLETCAGLLMIAENDTLPLPGRGTKTILCPTCRFSTYMENIAFIDNGGCSTSYSLTMTKLQNKEIESGSSISIKGSYGTKVCFMFCKLYVLQLYISLVLCCLEIMNPQKT